MPKIQVLEKHVAELIAAGEVVERPASVIKELVENSIDAKASTITIEIMRGGVSFMRITDNGCGIEKEDVPTAFLRHATSKVKNINDLDAISSLGFRGEALASVSAVAKVELLTKSENEDFGTRAVIHGSDLISIDDAGCPKGTTIVVRDIFYNVPARMKFLKKDVGEGNAVASVIDKIALSHPEISFRFIRDKKEVLYTPGDNKLSSAIYGVFGKDFLKGLMPVEYEMENVRVWGYACKPSSSRPTRTMQNFFINGRYVKSRTAMAAIEEGYKGSIMVGKFPSCVLHVEMECSMLDVNVHPAKIEVRFVNEKPIFNAIYHAIKSALMKDDKPKEIQFKPQVNIYAKPEEKHQQFKLPEKPIVQKPIIIEKPKIQEELYINPVVKSIAQDMMLDTEEIKSVPIDLSSKIENILDEMPMPEPILPVQKIETKETPKVEIIEETVEEIQVQKEEKPHKVIGEAFKNYLIIEYDNALMYIDKHAAHERLLYEKLKENTEHYAQTLLVPVTVSLDKLSYNAIIENLDNLDKAGFMVNDFGTGSVIVRSAPLSLSGQDVESAIIEISGYLLKQRTEITTEHLDWIYSNVACRAAIKAGTKSDISELIALAKKLEENPEIRYCPHGRPVYVMMKKSEIEKQFGRI